MNTESKSQGSSFWDAWGVILALSAVKLVVHLVTNALGGYGYFRDELYYLACSEHPAVGYVDEPPLSILILAVNRFVLGDSIFALRFLPAVVGATCVFLTGLLTKQLGGGKFAQGLACLSMLAGPIFLGMNTIYSMNTFVILTWILAANVVVVLLKTEEPRWWLVLGVVLGLGLLNKIDTLWLGFGLLCGLLLTPHRRWLKTPWPWIAGVIAFLFFLPFIVWNAGHDFAHLEFIRNALRKYQSQTPLTFISGVSLIHNPVALPLWIVGLIYLFRAEAGRFRILGYIFAAAFVILIVNIHSKAEYISAAFPIVFSGGSVAFERFFAERKSLLWLKYSYVGLLALSGIMLAPLALPVLPVQTFIRYSAAIGIGPSTAEGHRLSELPQFYADMFGWEDKVKAVADVYQRLSPEEQKKCAIFGDNYGRCGAIDFFGTKYGLPKSVGSHNNYWIWGPRDYTGELVIVLGGDLEHKQQDFESVEIAGTVHSDYAMPYENDLHIYVCRKLKTPLSQVWNTIKFYI